jgi:hypothetical protein
MARLPTRSVRLTALSAPLLCAAALALATAWPALAQGTAGAKRSAASAAGGTLLTRNPSWSHLTPAQRTALAPLEKEWSGIDALRKEKWLEIADRFPQMSPDERNRVQTRMTQWARMSPKERGEARLHYQELRQLTPAERQERWEKYQALPPEQRAKLAERGQPGADKAANAPGAAASRAPTAGANSNRKSNLVTLPPATPGNAKAVAPTVVQAKPGATTNLMSRPPAPPLHQQPGLPKVAATPGFVDSTTLLPRRGAQAAGVRAAGSASRPAPATVAPTPAPTPAPTAAQAPSPAPVPAASQPAAAQ